MFSELSSEQFPLSPLKTHPRDCMQSRPSGYWRMRHHMEEKRGTSWDPPLTMEWGILYPPAQVARRRLQSRPLTTCSSHRQSQKENLSVPPAQIEPGTMESSQGNDIPSAQPYCLGWNQVTAITTLQIGVVQEHATLGITSG